MTDSPADLVEAARTGDRAATARLLSLVERGGETASEIGRLTHPLGGEATTVGVTGPPGAGKSTLTSDLVAAMRRDGERVGVLAIDPTSPFSGGAILGDRVRMGEHATDDGVFIRSMASRGHLGGLSLATPEAVRVLDAVGYQWVVLETVGVGQVEVEVAGAADTTVVVVNPGWGDEVQAAKAGLLEIADIFVINKADRQGVDQTRRDLEQMLDLSPDDQWRAPIIEAVATEGDGTDEIWQALRRHREHLVETGRLDERRADRLAEELRSIVTERLRQQADRMANGPAYDEVQARVLSRDLDPWSAADELLPDSG